MSDSNRTLIPTMRLRFQSRLVHVPTNQLGRIPLMAQKNILQQCFMEGDKEVWIDVPIVAEGK